MLETSARLLQLLSLLQVRRHWAGVDLATRLDVTTRTVRNDIARLRELGYPIEAAPGVAGGYRLGRGADMPPLLLDDEEAVAVAVALRTTAGGSVTGIEETSVRALVKLEQMLPSRLRHRIDALRRFTVPVARTGQGVDPDVLTALAAVCRDRERLRFDYTSHSGRASVRAVEPYRLAHREGRWYLVAFDLDHDDWRTFRADRISPRVPTGPRFAPRPLPAEGVASYVDRGVAQATWEYRARVRILAPRETVAALLPPSAGELTAVDEESCLLDTGADDPRALLLHLGMLDLDFAVVDAPGLADELRRMIGRYERALG
ncbi:YafY family protein [Streptomyces sp. AC495_CC817]|uniref:helix-turn-helix transcriptional regulator n=1 Tax=Streptomyces sp. AC495_CC817 TaxID=2823900 RepID=UPI001C251A48|nr:WYL domain-containing protein [Streptomyces sp. AC495_CC817]